MKVYFYDYEVFNGYWFCGIMDKDSGKITHIENDASRLKKALEVEDVLWVGFNNARYDSLITTTILNERDPYETSKAIVYDLPVWKFSGKRESHFIKEIDLSQGMMGSLKEFEGWSDMMLDESDIPWDSEDLTNEQKEELKDYNRNDLRATAKLYSKLEGSLTSKVSLIDKYGLDSSWLLSTNAQIAGSVLGGQSILFPRYTPDRIPLPERVNANEELVDHFTKLMLDYWRVQDLKDSGVTGKEVQRENIVIDFGSVKVKYGTGGAHSLEDSEEWEDVWQLDVSSLYPNIIINYELFSPSALKKYTDILNERLELKRSGEKTINGALKLVLNSAYGIMGAENNPMYSPLQRLLVCFYGQMIITDLVESLQVVGDTLSVNTDGIVFKATDKDGMFKIVDEWQERLNLELEVDHINNVWTKDVNNYIALYDNGDVKVKGSMVSQAQSDTHKIKTANSLRKSKRIVATAVVAYFVDGTPVEDTVANENNLSEYTVVSKVAKKSYDFVYHTGKIIGHINRWVASTDKRLGTIKKHPWGKERGVLDQVAGVPEHAQLVNNELVVDKLDKQWYIQEAKDVIALFKGE